MRLRSTLSSLTMIGLCMCAIGCDSKTSDEQRIREKKVEDALRSAVIEADLADPNLLRKFAEEGDPDAQYRLGAMYHAGGPVTRDMAEAVKWYEKAAEQGVAEAQYNLGNMYLEGNGIAKDTAKAFIWYEKAAEQGIAPAQYNLGLSYLKGDGNQKSVDKAIPWLKKSAEQGHVEAQFMLGTIYYLGQGIEADEAKGIKWLRKAAGQGDKRAIDILGTTKSPGIDGREVCIAHYLAYRVLVNAPGDRPTSEIAFMKVISELARYYGESEENIMVVVADSQKKHKADIDDFDSRLKSSGNLVKLAAQPLDIGRIVEFVRSNDLTVFEK